MLARSLENVNKRKTPGDDLLSHAVTHAVPSARWGLTAVFGMGTGVAPTLWSPGSLTRETGTKPYRPCARARSPKRPTLVHTSRHFAYWLCERTTMTTQEAPAVVEVNGAMSWCPVVLRVMVKVNGARSWCLFVLRVVEMRLPRRPRVISWESAKPHDQLVRVSCTHCCASTSRLSTR